MSNEQINDTMNVIEGTKESRLFAAKKLSKWFELDITIKMFGVEIFHWHFPPNQK